MNKEDINFAKKARLNSHSPYTNFQTGAALRTKSGKVYLGCNIENHGIQSICAERTAFVKALSEGEKEFESITVVGGLKGEETTEKCLPCGYCRQFMREFVDDNFKVCVVNKEDMAEELTINELLPHSYKF
ncbi:MAG: cytidine deaminase [Clostridia bacterium]|nr:cytidine deaminase [Clostridia bacterium]